MHLPSTMIRMKGNELMTNGGAPPRRIGTRTNQSVSRLHLADGLPAAADGAYQHRLRSGAAEQLNEVPRFGPGSRFASGFP